LNKLDFIIIGAQKAGTTAAAFNLNKHPSISVFSGETEFGQAEIEFFNQHWDRGIDWYFDQLPKENNIIGEKTAELLHRTICHKRIHKVQPNVKLIVLLRCPVERAYSQWRMAALNKKDESRSFAEVVSAELQIFESEEYKSEFYECKKSGFSTWREGYILKGFYFEQLLSLFRFFSKEQVHISITEKLLNDKETGYNSIFSFLNVAPYHSTFENRFIGKENIELDKKTFYILKEIYKESNEKLFDMLGFKISEWD
jgi:hypothetical protein